MDQAQAFAEARNRMVDSQVRPNKVTDPRIIAAMRRLPRERFLPPRLASLAYADEDVPLGEGRDEIKASAERTREFLAALAPSLRQANHWSVHGACEKEKSVCRSRGRAPAYHRFSSSQPRRPRVYPRE